MGGGVCFVAFVATEEATGSAVGGEWEASFLGHFEAEAVALESTLVLFFVELPPRVFTITMV